MLLILKSLQPKSFKTYFLSNKNNSGKLRFPCPICLYNLQELKTKNMRNGCFSPVAIKNILPIFAGLSYSVYHSFGYEKCIQSGLDKSDRNPEQFKKMVATFQSMNQLEKSVSAESQNHRKSQTADCLQIQFGRWVSLP